MATGLAENLVDADGIYIDWWISQNAARQDAEIEVEGRCFWVPRSVFSPSKAFTYSSGIILDNLPDLDGKSVLDLGCGSGVLAVTAALEGAARVLATDIDDAALEATSVNVRKHGVEEIVFLKKSNLFEHVDDTFDVIFGNLPLVDDAWEELPSDVKTQAGCLLNSYSRYLNDDGEMFVPGASFSHPGQFISLLKRLDINFSEVDEKKVHDVQWYLWRIKKSAC